VIFVTVGTHHQPFERLLGALEVLDTDELVIQYGPGQAPAALRAEQFMPFDEMLKSFGEADTVITHAGVGSIICASREGHVPLVVPRRHDLGEHVDDHQVELTRALAERGSVIPVWDVDALAETVSAAPPRQPKSTAAEPALCPSVRSALLSR
jgi:UDP-N-acetylglucosamine transferase subunit ALG13